MYFEVEKSGCYERRGMVRVRFSFYLEPGEYGYEKHYVQVPDVSEDDYPGTLNYGVLGMDATTEKKYNDWIESLPKKWQNNPFHNHFCYYNFDVTEQKIRNDGKRFLFEAFSLWEKDQSPKNMRNTYIQMSPYSEVTKQFCEAKVAELKLMEIKGS